MGRGQAPPAHRRDSVPEGSGADSELRPPAAHDVEARDRAGHDRRHARMRGFCPRQRRHQNHRRHGQIEIAANAPGRPMKSVTTAAMSQT